MNKLFFIIFIVFLLKTSNIYPQKVQPDKWIVVLDAGHGGYDPGAVGKRCKEKDIVLDIVLRIGKYLKNHNEVDAVYTRQSDVFLKLVERTNIANKAKADLFISVHCNSNAKTTPNGTEVYVMGLDKSDENLDVAMKENSAALLEDNHNDNYGGIDPNSAEAYIVFSMFQNMFLERSMSAAKKVMKQMNSYAKLFDRGTKQAPFFVISRTTMPAILIEAGFISNFTDETFLISDIGKEKIAFAIYKAILVYKNETTNSSLSAVEMNINAEKETNEKAKTIIKDIDNDIVFKIQFASFKEKIALTDRRFNGLSGLSLNKIGEYYKYYCYESKSFTEISKSLEYVKNNGYADAFIVAYCGNKQITIKEARAINGE